MEKLVLFSIEIEQGEKRLKSLYFFASLDLFDPFNFHVATPIIPNFSENKRKEVLRPPPESIL